ncbi:MFS transporter [Actinoplanes sp. NPDC051475]|uniref:MFS transporter n=1 Tax=Actinoplanes sp. NPDC051475 TaxID=3157225 RepID=UPI00344C8992
MYLAHQNTTDRLRAPRGRGRVAANILALGVVSLVTDISSEMVTAVLPLYLVLGLGLSPLQFGFLDGLYGGVTAIVRIAAGRAADRTRRRKLVAGIGYALSGVCKLLLPAAGASVPMLGGVLAVDRSGKGIRTAPRDALIAASSSPGMLGRSFGVHRAMDTVGALGGPLVAVGLLATTGSRYDTVFVASFCIAMVAVLLLVLFVRDVPPPMPAIPKARVPWAWTPPVRRACAATALLGAVTIGDAFVYLLLQQRMNLSPTLFPLLPVGTAAGFLVLAVPFGRLADRFGRRTLFIAGHVALLFVYAVLLGPATGVVLAVIVLALHGTFYAATDGVLMALLAPSLPVESATTGFAMVQTAQAVARLVGGIGFGAAWTVWGPGTAVLVAAVGLVAALGGSMALLRQVAA